MEKAQGEDTWEGFNNSLAMGNHLKYAAQRRRIIDFALVSDFMDVFVAFRLFLVCQRFRTFDRAKTLSDSFNCLATADGVGDGDGDGDREGDAVLVAKGFKLRSHIPLSISLISIYETGAGADSETDNFKHIMLVWDVPVHIICHLLGQGVSPPPLSISLSFCSSVRQTRISDLMVSKGNLANY